MHDFISTYPYGVASKNIYNGYMAQYASPLYSGSITKLGIKKLILNSNIYQAGFINVVKTV